MYKVCQGLRKAAGKYSAAAAGRVGAAICAALIFVPGASVAHAATDIGAQLNQADAGAQLNQAREEMERQRIAQQMEEDQQKQTTQVETDVKTPEQSGSAAAAKFTLTKVEIDASTILSESELQDVTAPYIGKTVALSDLYAIREAINELYAAKGYMICKAYLPPQKIQGGVVQIGLMEGRTGHVTVNGLRYTREGYVTSRVPLQPDTIANTDVLNKRLQYFNGTNDVQLRMLVHAGEEPGTTDYEIVAHEPQNQSVTLYLDNSGYETSGRFRQGLFYNIRSLTGMRDSLRLSYLRSQGTNVFSVGYSVPVSKMGTRLDIDYNTNTTKIISGELENENVKGNAYAVGIALRHPIRVDGNHRDEVGIQYLNQKSVMDFGPVRWTDDRRNTIVPYISFAQYGDGSIFYHRHSFPFTSFKGEVFNGAVNRDASYMSYQLNMLYEKKYRNGQMFSARLDGQLANGGDRSSADYFYLGGSNSVRGYDESFIGGNKGVTLGLTYHFPLDKKQLLHTFVFFDYGWVSDDIDMNSGSYSAYSTGVGLSASYRNVYANLTLGIPLKKSFDFTTKKADSMRLDFVVSVTF